MPDARTILFLAAWEANCNRPLRGDAVIAKYTKLIEDIPPAELEKIIVDIAQSQEGRGPHVWQIRKTWAQRRPRRESGPPKAPCFKCSESGYVYIIQGGAHVGRLRGLREPAAVACTYVSVICCTCSRGELAAIAHKDNPDRIRALHDKFRIFRMSGDGAIERFEEQCREMFEKTQNRYGMAPTPAIEPDPGFLPDPQAKRAGGAVLAGVVADKVVRNWWDD
jgi:hypothetical protein